jgi:YihY family inner membrane protein
MRPAARLPSLPALPRRDPVAAGDQRLPFATGLANLIRAMWQQAGALRLAQAAGSLAFLSLLALVPMFTIGFAVLAALPVFSRMRDALQGFLAGNLFPAAFSQTLLEHLNQFAAKAGELSLVGAVAFFVTAFTALLTIEATLNRIWEADRRRPLTLRLTLYWAVMTLGPLFMATSITANGIVMTQWLRDDDAQNLRSLWLVLLPGLTTFVGLTLLYRLVPATYVRWREAVAGALAASLLLELLRRAIGLYVATLPSYTVVYGAFAALPLLLLWLFLGWTVLLGGALLAANLRWWRRPDVTYALRTMADRFDDARAVLAAMAVELGDRVDAAMPARRFEALFHGDPRRAVETAGLLVSLGYLTRFVTLTEVIPPEQVSGLRRLLRRWKPDAGGDADEDDPTWAERWGWAEPPAGLSLRCLFDAVWQPHQPDSSQSFPARFLDAPLVPGRQGSERSER